MLLLHFLAACGGGAALTPGDPSTDDTADPPTDDTGDPPTELELLSVEAGATCPLAERMGQVALWSDGSGSGQVRDAPEPKVGPATVVTEDCTYHRYDAGACGQCPGDWVCGGDGECTRQPISFKDLVISGVSGEDSFTWEAEQQTGWAYGSFGDPGAAWELQLQFGGLTVDLPPLTPAPALSGLELVVEVDESWTYGALDITWTPEATGTLVHTEIPINHHAQPGTFTACQAPADDGSIHASAEQIEPLSVHTGLEFQGLAHVDAVAVHTSLGCVEVLAGTWMYATPVEQ